MHRNLTNIHIRMNWEKLGKYARRNRQLKTRFNHRQLAAFLEAIKLRQLQQGGKKR